MNLNHHIHENFESFTQSRAEINAKFRKENMSDGSIENKLSYEIIGAALKVHSQLGPGLLESVYEAALSHELRKSGMIVRNQLPIPMHYDTIKLDIGFRLDLLVNELVIVEVKSVESINEVHQKQLLTYLKLSGKKLGLLINFNSFPLKKNIQRIVNNL